ncbi:HNH endonuclease signature motif containing protein [Mycolicibacterium novocastrense]|uniref:HNH endonuclease signature motif containing protein n=1 Tax=Mycolicibacterium novocastrense TaxID=59813 RepID=UPI000AC1030E|nr:HNH endonuclease signature motif containing protein [Mycolicibacterium novocastrense]
MSVGRGTLEHMFDSEFSEADDAAVVAAIEESTRAEARAGARRLAAIAELARRRVDDDDRAAFDGWDAAAAEVAAAMTVGHRRASAQMRIAIALRDRLPRVAALYLQGAINSRVVSALTWRTQLVYDDEALALIDAALAEGATKWGRLSDDKLERAIDAWVERYDPEALRHSETTMRSRDFSVGDIDDPAGTTSVWGRLLATDGAVLKRRIAAMVQGLCDADPRSAGERRSDAVGAMISGNDRLACRCGSDTCPSADVPRSSNVVVNVFAERSAAEAALQQPTARESKGPAPTARESQGPAPTAGESKAKPPTALLLGEDILPAPLLAQLIRDGAKIRPIKLPSDEPEPRYRPSADLAQFVRMRDLHCRAPGCSAPADRCDIDHTAPYPFGPTHASNLKCLCRKHHLAKTFGGWDDVQLPDGTVIWTSPSGRNYTTKPGSRLFFPTWDTTTADLPPPPTSPPTVCDRGLMMPLRRRSRAAEYAARIKAERARNRRPAPF